MRCSEPGESVVVAIIASRAPGRRAWVVRRIRATSMSSSTPQSRRVVFWVCFLGGAGVCLALALSGQHRRRQGGRTAEMLRSLLASDTRFQKVTVSLGTNGRVFLHGSVAAKEDLRALRTL